MIMWKHDLKYFVLLKYKYRMLIYEKYFVLECNISLCSFEKNINCDKMHWNESLSVIIYIIMLNHG